MNWLKAFCLLVSCAALFSSCAGSYHPIYPQSVQYSHSSAPQAAVDMGYRYGVLAERGNRKFVLKEGKKGIHVAAVQLTNNTDRPLTFGRDIQLTNNGAPIAVLPNAMVYNALKQQSPLFLLYLLLAPLKLHYTNREVLYPETKTYPLGLILGPGLAFGNMAVASNNNKKFQAELMTHELNGRVIQPGETVWGLVGLGGIGYPPLSIKLLDNH